MVRLLPDAELLVLSILRTSVTGVGFGSKIPDDIASRLPYVVIRRGGGAAIHPRFLDRPAISVDAWHTSKGAASDLAEDVRVALLTAWEQQTTTEYGHLAYFDEDAHPSELHTNDQPETLFRYQATYSIATRPPRRA